VRENRSHGSEGGEAQAFPTPIRARAKRGYNLLALLVDFQIAALVASRALIWLERAIRQQEVRRKAFAVVGNWPRRSRPMAELEPRKAPCGLLGAPS